MLESHLRLIDQLDAEVESLMRPGAGEPSGETRNSGSAVRCQLLERPLQLNQKLARYGYPVHRPDMRTH